MPLLLERLRARLGLMLCLLMGLASVGSAQAQPSKINEFKAAAVAYDPQWGDLQGNIARIAKAVSEVADQGVKLMVFPEQATTGYIFDDFEMVRPYLDTIPGKATDAIAKVTRDKKVYVSVGIAEIDPDSGLGFNSVALIGPEGYIGKYRKHGLNWQDQRWVSQGNLGFPVFDTEIGRITMIICYDDTYWQYGRLAALHNADIILWSSASDRVMPGTPKRLATGNHSTVANVQYLSKFSGAWVVAATRNGIETNPITGQQLYYNGGSSIWRPDGNKVAQAQVLPPETIKPGLQGFVTADINLSVGKPIQKALLERRRPSMYGLLSLYRSPTNTEVTTTISNPQIAAQAATAKDPLAYAPPTAGGLLVLPALFRSGPGAINNAPELEIEGGPSEIFIAELAKQGQGYVVGSYARKSENRAFHTVVLAGPHGKIMARYDATHPDPQAGWVSPGNRFVVVPTSIGRIGLTLGEELEVSEVFGHLSAQRADIIAAPARQIGGVTLQIDPKLMLTEHPPNTPFVPYAAAKLSQTWLAIAGWSGTEPSTWIFGPEPVIETAPQRNAAGTNRVEHTITTPWPGTYINQQKLIDGQLPLNTIPLVLDTKSTCFEQWNQAPGWLRACW
jgi:predicted amidohydrolase